MTTPEKEAYKRAVRIRTGRTEKRQTAVEKPNRRTVRRTEAVTRQAPREQMCRIIRITMFLTGAKEK